ncbi:MAG TPA: phospholipid carrier-dependent glycosyltransferase [Actinocrinis sp.]
MLGHRRLTIRPEPPTTDGRTTADAVGPAGAARATEAAGATGSASAAARRLPRPSLIALVLAGGSILGLALRLYQLSRPGYLLGVTEYDDGVYFGSAVQLLHGKLPYRDYIIVHPPGITLLMTPVALLSFSLGTAKSLAVARVLMAYVGAASVPLGGLVVRHRGVFATTVTCGILAVFPDAIAASHTVLLEPWLVLFCLIGALAVFDGDRLAALPERRRALWRSRIALGGVAFGFAGAVKVWAVLPALVIAALCLPAARRALTFAGGVAAGFLVPVLPFAATAPRTFFDSVIVAQVVRFDASRTSLWARLSALSGVTDFSGVGHSTLMLIALAIPAVVIGCSAAASLATRRPPPPLELFVSISAVLVAGSFLWPDDFSYHYGGFFAPFLALALGLTFGRCIASLPPFDGSRWQTGVICLVVVAIAWMSFIQARAESGSWQGDPAAAADRVIPPGACVLTDMVSLTVAADRIVSDVPDCPLILDGVGTDYSLSHGRNGVVGAGESPAVEATWLSAFEHAQYVWLSCVPAASPLCYGSTNRRIPWTPTITGYFESHFKQVTTPGAPAGIFERDSDAPPSR